MLYNGIILVTELLSHLLFTEIHPANLEPSLLPPQVVFSLHWYLVMRIPHTGS